MLWIGGVVNGKDSCCIFIEDYLYKAKDYLVEVHVQFEKANESLVFKTSRRMFEEVER